MVAEAVADSFWSSSVVFDNELRGIFIDVQHGKQRDLQRTKLGMDIAEMELGLCSRDWARLCTHLP